MSLARASHADPRSPPKLAVVLAVIPPMTDHARRPAVSPPLLQRRSLVFAASEGHCLQFLGHQLCNVMTMLGIFSCLTPRCSKHERTNMVTAVMSLFPKTRLMSFHMTNVRSEFAPRVLVNFLLHSEGACVETPQRSYCTHQPFLFLLMSAVTGCGQDMTSREREVEIEIEIERQGQRQTERDRERRKHLCC